MSWKQLFEEVSENYNRHDTHSNNFTFPTHLYFQEQLTNFSALKSLR